MHELIPHQHQSLNPTDDKSISSISFALQSQCKPCRQLNSVLGVKDYPQWHLLDGVSVFAMAISSDGGFWTGLQLAVSLHTAAVDDVWVHHACASDTTLVGIVLKVSVGLDSWAIGTDHHSSSPSSPLLTLPEFALASRFTPHRAKPLIHNLTGDGAVQTSANIASLPSRSSNRQLTTSNTSLARCIMLLDVRGMTAIIVRSCSREGVALNPV